MLHALFADVGHVVDADGLAKAFGPLWDRYIPVGDAVTMTDEVKIELGRQSAPPAEQA